MSKDSLDNKLKIPIVFPLPSPIQPGEGGSFFSNSRNNINMPSAELYTVGENLHRNKNYSNLLGDMVDNSAGINLAKRIGNSAVKSYVNVGISLRMQAAPSWLYKGF